MFLTSDNNCIVNNVEFFLGFNC